MNKSTKILLMIFDRLGVNTIYRFINKDKAIILYYHGICDDNFTLLKGYDERHIPKSIFEEQVKFLKTKDYVFCTISDLVYRIQSKKKINKLVVLTFDDGFINVIENAYPIMRELNVKGCFYLVSNLISKDKLLWTDYIETLVRNAKRGNFEFIFNGKKINYTLNDKKSNEKTMLDLKNKLRSIPNRERIEHMKQFGNIKIKDIPKEFLFANWEQIQNLDKRILEIGCHSSNHPNLTTLNSYDELEEEIKNSKFEIENNIDYKVNHFCYPAGIYNDKIIKYIKMVGYQSAVTIKPGFVDKNSNLFLLKRIAPTTNPYIFRSLISGSYFTLCRFKEFCRRRIRISIFGISNIYGKLSRKYLVLSRMIIIKSLNVLLNYLRFVSTLKL